MKTSLCTLFCVICLSIAVGFGNAAQSSTLRSLSDLKGQVAASQVRISDLETVVTKLHKMVTSQQESLERQGNVNTSLMNITEQLVKERNVR